VFAENGKQKEANFLQKQGYKVNLQNPNKKSSAKG
jgi:hypothetical protein